MATGGTRTVRLDPAADAAAGALQLAVALDAWGPGRAAELAPHPFLRVEQPLAAGDPLDWLRAHRALLRVYFRGRSSAAELAGVGVCVEHEGPPLDALDQLLGQLGTAEEAGAMRLVGTLRFDAARPAAPAWSAFGRARFHLPLLEMQRRGGACLLAVNLKAGGAALGGGHYDAQRRTALRLLRGTSPEPLRPPVPAAGDADDARAAWTAGVAALLGAIERGAIEKAVLARVATRHLPGVDPLDLLRHLRDEQPGACPFLVQPSPVASFVGASPEHLYHRVGRRVRTEALAGTRPRGATPDRDSLLAGELLRSEKDRREHDHVKRHVVAGLEGLCDTVEARAEPELYTLPTVHHLRTPITGSLKPGVGDAALLAALHPTPAVCGTPTDAARELLQAHEGFDRGLYAGPIGCFGVDESEVAVAIRSALLRGDSVQLFAGAGIVAGSDPDAEWQETVEKMRAFERLLGAGHAS